MTIDQFVEKYTPVIIRYINSQNSKASTFLDPGNFVRVAITVFFKVGALENFDPAKEEFDAYLDRFLVNFYSSPKTYDELFERHSKTIEIFIYAKNKKSSTFIDPGEFVSSERNKLLEKKY
jgi:hypothetical protein